MKKNKRFLIIVLIIIIISGTAFFIFNSKDNITKNSSWIKGNIEIATSSNERFIGQMTLSTEKTTEAMENNSNVLQKAIDDVSNAGGGTITLPSGTYYFAPVNTYTNIASSQERAYYAIECRDNVKLVGAGTNESDSNSCTILKPYGNNLDLSFTMFQYISQETPKRFIENADFADFIIDSSETSKKPSASYLAQGKGFSFQAFKDCDWNNVVIKNTDGTGFGMDYPINSTVTNCVAIGCGKAASDTDIGASGFGIGTGYSENESIKISDCLSIGNRKFGIFFEHQGRFENDVTARTSKGFIVTNCVARGNMYNFGGEKSNDVIFVNCSSENSKSGDPNPLGNKNKTAFYFGTNSRRSYVQECNIEEKFDNITDTVAFYYEPVIWAANNSIIDSGESKTEYNALEECGKAEAIVMLWRFAGRPGEVLIGKEQVNTGYDDVLCYAPVASVVTQSSAILGRDGCLNFFAGPTDNQFSAPINFYDVHYNSTHVMGTTGGNTDDMIESLKLTAEGRINPAVMVTHIGGLDAVAETTLNLPKIPGGKKLIYTHLSMPLTALADLRAKGEAAGDERLIKLADIVDGNNGLWCPEAEEYLLANFIQE